MNDGSEPIDPEEIIYRRISPVFMRLGDPFPSPEAFKPREDDVEGLSVYRAKYVSRIEEIAYNNRNIQFFVAVLTAQALFDERIRIIPSPDIKNAKPGHAHIPEITYKTRRTDFVVNLMNLLATKLCSIQGPFPQALEGDGKYRLKGGLIRRYLVGRDPVQAMETLLRILGKFKSNEEFLKAATIPQ